MFPCAADVNIPKCNMVHAKFNDYLFSVNIFWWWSIPVVLFDMLTDCKAFDHLLRKLQTSNFAAISKSGLFNFFGHAQLNWCCPLPSSDVAQTGDAIIWISFLSMLNKVSANERRRYTCNVFSHWLRPSWSREVNINLHTMQIMVDDMLFYI